MNRSRPEGRQLRAIADELMADERIAALIALFSDQYARRTTEVSGHGTGSRCWRTCRLPRVLLYAFTALAIGTVAGSIVVAQLTGLSVYLAGTVLMVPAFVLFGQSAVR